MSIAIASRNDGDAVRIGHTNRDRCSGRRGELAKRVVSEERQVRLTGAMVNHSEDVRIRIEVGLERLRCG